MLTKDLLQYRIRQGRAHPSFVDAADSALLQLAAECISLVDESMGTERAEIEQRLAARASAFERPKIGHGLVKLLLDRVAFEEPAEEARSIRSDTFDIAAEALRALSNDATPEDWERAVSSTFANADERRATLYADHPNERLAVEWRAVDATALLNGYNLALVQGLVMRARRVTVHARAPDVLRVRKVLRWLKFCRLVADVTPTDDDWSIDVEGPAEILSMSRKYGLQLAIFVSAVPVFERWTLTAQLDFAHGKPVRLELDERSPLVAPTKALGHVPEEIDVIAKKLEDADWRVDLTPTPRVVGLGAACVPDLTVTHRSTKVKLWVEFFHRWHRSALQRRLQDLEQKPDPRLLIAVDDALLKDETLRAQVAAHPQAMTFKGFPSERKLKALLEANRKRLPKRKPRSKK